MIATVVNLLFLAPLCLADTLPTLDVVGQQWLLTPSHEFWNRIAFSRGTVLYQNIPIEAITANATDLVFARATGLAKDIYAKGGDSQEYLESLMGEVGARSTAVLQWLPQGKEPMGVMIRDGVSACYEESDWRMPLVWTFRPVVAEGAEELTPWQTPGGAAAIEWQATQYNECRCKAVRLLEYEASDKLIHLPLIQLNCTGVAPHE